MVYTPHILDRMIQTVADRDGFGRLVSAPEAEWERICRCRCDHTTDAEYRTEDGSVFRPQWRVVCEGNDINVRPGDRVRVTRPDGKVLCEGVAYPTKKLNYLPYAEVYIKS